MEEYLQKSNQLNRLEAKRQLLAKALLEGNIEPFIFYGHMITASRN